MPYKQIFTRAYPFDALSGDLGDIISLLPDGRLSIRLSSGPEVVDIGVQEPIISTLVLTGDESNQAAETPDGRYRLEIDTFDFEGDTEFWLVHIDKANGKFKRAKLTSAFREGTETEPRVAVSPGGTFFLADDSGTLRLYTAAHFVEAGTFQVAHAKTENRIVALAVSADERLIAGLSSWKDIVLYNVPDRKVAFVRQIRDEVGWYDSTPAHILVAGNAEAIVTVGLSHEANTEKNPRFSINAFRFIPLNAA